MEIRECDNCKKRQGRKCLVLTEMVGKDDECWAWTDDPRWEAEAEEATREYEKRWLERHGGIDEAAV